MKLMEALIEVHNHPMKDDLTLAIFRPDRLNPLTFVNGVTIEQQKIPGEDLDATDWEWEICK